MVERARQDSTLSKIGDLYHYTIALLECFNMGKDDTLYIEKNGDISTISKNGSVQIEVKHHINEDSLNNRSDDFWKTLAYWYKDFDRYSKYSILALHTTSKFGARSIFKDWNRQPASTRLTSLRGIFKDSSTESESHSHYKAIFGEEYDENKLLSLLGKIDIRCSQADITGISNSFDTHLGHLPPENRDAYIAALLGNIMQIASEKPHIWIISRSDFDLLQQKLISSYIDPGVMRLPDDFLNESISEEDVEDLKSKTFVQAIYDINYSRVVVRAIEDYWKTNKTVAGYFVNNPLYNKSIEDYKLELQQRLSFEKETIINRAGSEEQKEPDRLSRALYSTAMAWPANDFGSIIANRGFFQRGVMHNLVDEEKFFWKIAGEDFGY